MAQTIYADPLRKSTSRQRTSSKVDSMYQSHDYKKKFPNKDAGDTGSDENLEDAASLIEIN
jgi:hypothetical protein